MKDRESAEGIMKQSYSVRDGGSSGKFATVETRGERDSNDEKANESSPAIEEGFPERRREEEEKTFSNEGYARSKFASISETDRHRRGEKTSSNSDSEVFEQESRHILYRLEKQSHLARTEDIRDIRKPSSYSNGDEQTWRSLARDYEFEEGHGTLEAQSYAPIPSSKERENNRERLQSRGKNNEQISPNEESAGSEKEEKRALLQGEGRFKHQSISERKTGRRQRSRSFDRRRSSSQESDRNRKSPHHHRRHHYRHHHHRHHHKRDARQSERNIVVTEKDQDSSSD